MSQIRDITIEGFRSIKSIDLELRPLNVLIGANGSGKSNLLIAIKMLRLAVMNRRFFFDFVEKSGGANRLLHFGSKSTPAIKFKVKFLGDTAEFFAELRYGSDDKLFPRLTMDERDVPSSYMESLYEAPGVSPALQFIGTRVGRWRHFHFNDTSEKSPMKQVSEIFNNREIDANGSNLASVLYLLREKYKTEYASIRYTVQQVAPFFEDFELKPSALNEEMIRLEWKHRESEGYFNASSLSDGTLRFMALATLLLHPVSLRPPVILLDEPELGLHPYAIHLLAAMLKQASADSQIIVATQSPILLDHFEPEDVLVAERVNGATEFNRPDAERLKVWLEDYSLGQLWEKNELGGRPGPETLRRSSQE